MTTLRIAVDARQIYRSQRRGTGKNLIDLYSTLADVRPQWHFSFLSDTRHAGDPLALVKAKTRRCVSLNLPGMDRFDLWEQVALPASARLDRCPILHSPYNTGPFRPFSKMLLTVHDLIPYDMAPESAKARDWLARVGRSIAAARHVVTPSEYSKQRMCDVLNVPPAKITVNPWAPDRKVHRVEDVEVLRAVRIKYGLDAEDEYLFGFGADDPRKNTRRAIEAYSRLSHELRGRFQFLLVGINARARPSLEALVEELGVADSVHLHGFADEEDLSALLSGSFLLAFPSLNEGFGLPVLDAFLCGAPVLTSNRTSLPEAAGDAAVLVDPESVEAIADGYERLLTDPAFARALAERGSERVRAFTWNRVATTIAKVFEEMA